MVPLLVAKCCLLPLVATAASMHTDAAGGRQSGGTLANKVCFSEVHTLSNLSSSRKSHFVCHPIHQTWASAVNVFKLHYPSATYRGGTFKHRSRRTPWGVLQLTGVARIKQNWGIFAWKKFPDCVILCLQHGRLIFSRRGQWQNISLKWATRCPFEWYWFEAHHCIHFQSIRRCTFLPFLFL